MGLFFLYWLKQYGPWPCKVYGHVNLVFQACTNQAFTR